MIEYWVLLLVIASIAVGLAVGARRSGTRKMMRRGPLLIALIVFGVFGGKRLIDAFSGTALDFAWQLFPYVASAVEWFAILSWPLRQRRAGHTLEDLGPHSRRNVALVLSAGAALQGTAGIIEAIRSQSLVLENIGFEVFLLSTALTGIAIARSRVRLTDVGIQTFEDLMHWDEILSWRWERGGTVDTLRLKVRFGPFKRRVGMEVRTEQRPALERALNEHARPANAELMPAE